MVVPAVNNKRGRVQLSKKKKRPIQEFIVVVELQPPAVSQKLVYGNEGPRERVRT